MATLNAALDLYFSYNECGTIPDYEERIIGTFPVPEEQPYPTYHQITSKNNIFHFQYLKEEGEDNWVTWLTVEVDNLTTAYKDWSYMFNCNLTPWFQLDHQRIIGSVPFHITEKWGGMPNYVQVV